MGSKRSHQSPGGLTTPQYRSRSEFWKVGVHREMERKHTSTCVFSYILTGRSMAGSLSLVLLASTWDTSTNSIPRPGLDDLPPQDGRDLLSLPGLHICLIQQCAELRRGTLVDGHMSVAGYCSVNHCALASGGSVMTSDCFPNLSPRLRTVK